MKISSTTIIVALLTMVGLLNRPVSATDIPPQIATFSKPAAGSMEILFRGSNGPFLVQTRDSLDQTSPWYDIPNAMVTEVQTGVYIAYVPSPKGTPDLAFYRIIAEGEGGSELNGWTAILRVSAPANGVYFA